MIDEYKKKIDNSIINTDPYPHFIIDNFLQNKKMKDVKKFWPNEYLHDDHRGSNCFYFSSELKNVKKDYKDFWKYMEEKNSLTMGESYGILRLLKNHNFNSTFCNFMHYKQY